MASRQGFSNHWIAIEVNEAGENDLARLVPLVPIRNPSELAPASLLNLAAARPTRTRTGCSQRPEAAQGGQTTRIRTGLLVLPRFPAGLCSRSPSACAGTREHSVLRGLRRTGYVLAFEPDTGDQPWCSAESSFTPGRLDRFLHEGTQADRTVLARLLDEDSSRESAGLAATCAPAYCIHLGQVWSRGVPRVLRPRRSRVAGVGYASQFLRERPAELRRRVAYLPERD